MKKTVLIITALLVLAVISFLIIQYTDVLGIKCGNSNTKPYIAQEKFAELNDIIDKCFEMYSKDNKQEINVQNLLRSFGMYGPNFEEKYSKWVSLYPNSYQPYLARGVYFYSLGVKSRGAELISETSKTQLENMRSFLKKSRKNLYKSISLKKGLLHAYTYLVYMAKVDGIGDKHALLKVALSLDPSSFMIRSAFMESLLPRWGGSAKEMALFVEETQPYFKTNPKLEILKGRLAADVGDRSFRSYRYEDALRSYNSSLQWGDFWLYNTERGALYSRLKQYGKSLDDLNKAIEEYPYHARAYYERCFTYSKLEKYEEAVKDCTRSIEVSNGSARSFMFRGILYARMKDFHKALLDYDKAIKINPKENETYKWRGRASMTIGDFYSAIDDFDKVLLRNTNDNFTFNSRGYSYYKLGEYEKALADYKRAAEIDPNNNQYKKNIRYAEDRLR